MHLSLLTAGLLGMLCALPTLAFTTPRRWWQQPTLFALGLLALCSFLFAQAFLFALGKETVPEIGSSILAPPSIMFNLASSEPAHELSSELTPTPAPARLFRSKYKLNLRAHASTSAAQLSTIAANQIVEATGVRQGDWWKVRVQTHCEDAPTEGWVSSLWLRRLEEMPYAGTSAGSKAAQPPRCEMRKR